MASSDLEMDSCSYCKAEIRAAFYPKFENEKSDDEVRMRIIKIVSEGSGILEVSLKHSGSLFMYAGHSGGAYVKNSFGNIYTAVGVFVLSRMLREAWGTKALEKEAEFNYFLEKNRLCVSMELVTAVLDDHGQRPREDYVVVTAVTELGNGKPKFYSTPEIVAFCREWRLPTNHVWLFSTRKTVTSFFAAYDNMCEEGTASQVSRALDELADISIPGTKDHVVVQGEILEGLVARIVSSASIKHMEDVLRDCPPPPIEGANFDFGPSLRDIFAANTNKKHQINTLLKSVGPSFCPNNLDWFRDESTDSHARNTGRSVVKEFVKSHPTDCMTEKLKKMMSLLDDNKSAIEFKCYPNFHKANDVSSNHMFYKMVVHVRNDSIFRSYQYKKRLVPGVWPLYRGFFIDIDMFKLNDGKDVMQSKSDDNIVNGVIKHDSTRGRVGLADDDHFLMIKLKFLPYKLRTFLIRNGLSKLFQEGPASYRAYYLRQMEIWGTSVGKQKKLSKMLDEWAAYIKKKYQKMPSHSTYLSEAEPFLEQYAKRSPDNLALIGSAGNLVRTEDLLAIVEEEEEEVTPATPIAAVKGAIQKDEGLIVFFPGIPGCAKSALCKELLNAPGGFGDDRPVFTMMGDLVKRSYRRKVAEKQSRNPRSIVLADKNAPNEEAWNRVEEICWEIRASAVPVVPDCEGTESNPYSLDALAVFMFRVLQRVNHPGNLDKASTDAGYVLLKFYDFFEGKSRREFESEMIERFGSLVKMPLLRSDRSPLPNPVKLVLEEGKDLYELNSCSRDGLELTKETYAVEWAKWEKRLRETLFANSEYLSSVQVPLQTAVLHVLEHLRSIGEGGFRPPRVEKRKLGSSVYAAVSLPVTEVRTLLNKLAATNPIVAALLKCESLEEKLQQAHVTLAHKKSHGVTAVARYGEHLNRAVPIELTALLFNRNMAALTARPGLVDGETVVVCMNEWPHVTVWTREGVSAKEANSLPRLCCEGKATLVEIKPPVVISGPLKLF